MGAVAARQAGGGSDAGGSANSDPVPLPPAEPGRRQAAGAIRPQYTREATLNGHKSMIFALAALPDGRIASASHDETVRVWDRRGGCVHILRGHSDVVWDLAVTLDGELVSAGYEGNLKVWDLAAVLPPGADRCRLTLEGHQHMCLCLAVMPCGHVVVSGGGDFDDTIRTWDVPAGRELMTLNAQLDGVWNIAVMKDGRVVGGGGSGAIKIFDLACGSCIQLVQDGHTHCISSVTPLPDGRVISSCIDGHFKIWDGVTGQCLHAFEDDSGSVEDVALLPDEGRLVSSGTGKTLKVWGRHGDCLQIVSGHLGNGYCLLVLADGRIASGGGGTSREDPAGRIQIWHDAQRAAEKTTVKQVARQLGCEDVATHVLKFL